VLKNTRLRLDVLSEKRAKRRSKVHGCDYIRLWKDPLTQSPHQYIGSFLHSQYLNQLYKISSLPRYILKKKKEWRSWRVCVWLWWREKERENKDVDVVAVAVGRESRTRNDHWQWEQLRDRNSQLWERQSLTISSCKWLRKREITGCVNKIEAPHQNHPSIITVSFNSIPGTPDETVQQTKPFPNPCQFSTIKTCNALY